MKEWKRLTPESMPPVDRYRSFLLCRAAFDPDERMMSTARHMIYYGEPRIVYMKGQEGWRVLEPDDWSDVLWQEIDYPGAEWDAVPIE